MLDLAHRLVANTCRDVAQRQHVRRCEPLRDDARPAPDADPSRAADQAMIVVLKDALGFSFEEIAAERGMPVGTAKCYAHRGRNHLRTALETVNRHVA